jgi:DNA-binding transcriptional ArsR family regulator
VYYHVRMRLRNSAIVDVTAPAASFGLEVAASTAAELLVELFVRSGSADRRRSPELAAVGDRTGEVWLHLLGLALENEAQDAAAFVELVRDLQPLELRRHLLGAYVPSWRQVAGAKTIERAARGDTEATAALLANRRYYGGQSRAALATLLPLSPEKAKARVLAALDAAVEAYAPREPEIRMRLDEDAGTKSRLLHQMAAHDLIDAAARGYRYEAEAEFPRVMLIPQLAAAPSILLCQHRDARLIVYPASVDAPSERDRLFALGRAIGDEKRLALLEVLRDHDATLAELAERLGLAKSTTHHHLGRLRAAQLVTLRGNAERYTYSFNPAGFAAARELLGRL